MKILLIDPDEYYHTHFAEALGPGDELVIAKQASGARILLEESRPEALVMELLLPDSAGYELLEQIKDYRHSRNLPVIIFSQVDNLEDIQESLNYGINGYFVKGKDSIQDVKNLLLRLTD